MSVSLISFDPEGCIGIHRLVHLNFFHRTALWRFKSIFLLAFIAVHVSCVAQDWRRVGQSVVDLKPVHDWMKGKEGKGHKGERPMPHWQELRIMEWKGNLSTYARCVVKLEDGKLIEVLIDNVESAVRDPFIKLQQLDEQLAKAQMERAEDKADMNSTPKKKRGAIRAEVKQDKLEVEALKTQRAKLLPMTQAAAKSGFLAMFTGKNYSGLPVWDCGAKVDPPRETAR